MLQDHILRDGGVYGMQSDFDRALDDLSVSILDFDLSIFTSKDIAPHLIINVVTFLSLLPSVSYLKSPSQFITLTFR